MLARRRFEGASQRRERTSAVGPTDAVIALAGALLLFGLYMANGRVLMTGDAEPNVYLAVNVVENGCLGYSQSRTPGLFERTAGAGLRPTSRTDPRTGEPLYVSIYGPGAGLAAVPVFAALRPFVGDLRAREAPVFLLGKVAAALLAAAAAALLYLAARTWLAQGGASLLAAAFGMGTGAWSSSSQALWQHAPTSFFVMLGTYAFVRGGAAWTAAAGAALMAATACRPAAAVFALGVGGYLLARDRRAAAAFAAGALPVVLALAGYNQYWLGSPLRSGQLSIVGGDPGFWSTPLLEGLAGILVSPSRGLFVFSPFLLLAIPGAWLAWRREEYAPLRPLSVSVVLLVLIHAKWRFWWGGHSYGYRIIVDAAGPMTLLVVPVLRSVTATWARRVVLGLVLGWSAAVHALGAAVSGGTWSLNPNIDDPRNQHRLWSVAGSAIPFEAARLYRFVRTGSPAPR